MEDNAFDYFDVHTWSRRARRIFVLTCPISFPLWLASCVLIVLVALILGGPIVGLVAIGSKLEDLWKAQ